LSLALTGVRLFSPVFIGVRIQHAVAILLSQQKGVESMVFPSLVETAAALHTGELDLLSYINQLCDLIDASEPHIQALVPETARRARLLHEAQELQMRFPDPTNRPQLYGIPVGIKDIFRVNGFPTRAGSQLPVELFTGPESDCVRTLRSAGALILGKTVTTEFAYFEPGPTRNPRNLDYSPGGSSSGSAAAVAADFCPLAIGTQTIGSTIRPAAFCGVVGFKSSYGRIPMTGGILCSETFDHVGIFTSDVAGMQLAAAQLFQNWSKVEIQIPGDLPSLGVPDGPYLEQASAEGLAAFEHQLALLKKAGYIVRHVQALEEIDAINRQHSRLVFAEMAQVHSEWFAHFESLYRPRTASAIREGREVSNEELAILRDSPSRLRAELESLMVQAGIDMWVCPSAPGPAPKGITSTGSPLMNLPWTHAGMPAISLPAGYAAHSLPLGLQCVGAFMADESLLQWAVPLAKIVHESGDTDL
jgi:Asp-tRNA(Asn)/Glu-tRNA(Gln) amidotransferase A subunit family amidase